MLAAKILGRRRGRYGEAQHTLLFSTRLAIWCGYNRIREVARPRAPTGRATTPAAHRSGPYPAWEDRCVSGAIGLLRLVMFGPTASALVLGFVERVVGLTNKRVRWFRSLGVGQADAGFAVQVIESMTVGRARTSTSRCARGRTWSAPGSPRNSATNSSPPTRAAAEIAVVGPSADPSLRCWTDTALRFLDAALAPAGMHNVLGRDGVWRDAPHVGDHVGRAAWGLGVIAGSPLDSDGRARRLLDRVLPLLGRTDSLRTVAYAALGLTRCGDRSPGGDEALITAGDLAGSNCERGSAIKIDR